MADKHTTLYRVGWLGQRDNDKPEGSVERRVWPVLIVLGDYRAGTAATAVRLALEDSSNGGVPGHSSQRMAAIPVSRWSEFAGTARQRTEWQLTPTDGSDQTTLPEAD